MKDANCAFVQFFMPSSLHDQSGELPSTGSSQSSYKAASQRKGVEVRTHVYGNTSVRLLKHATRDVNRRDCISNVAAEPAGI